MKIEDEIAMKKVVWAFMLEYGVSTDGNWSYYGGGWKDDNTTKGCDWRYSEKRMNSIRNKVQLVGVDWKNTEIPEYETQHAFENTGADSRECECFLGEIRLKDGSSYVLGTSEVSEAAKHAHACLAKSQTPSDRDGLVAKYFGE